MTLTYSPQHLPASGSLEVRDWQLFAKRLRKRRGPFRFFMAGEYGDQLGRPHYHAILFGHAFTRDRVEIKPGKFGSLYYSEELAEIWGKGHASVGEVSWQSIAYVARYSLKKITGDQAEAHYQGRRPEFCTMSRRPGLGDAWIKRFKDDVYPSDETVVNGKRMRTPRYYDGKLSEHELELVKAKRKALGLERSKDLTRDRLASREHILRSRNAQRGSL